MTKEELISGKPFKVKGNGAFRYKIEEGSVYSCIHGFDETWRYEGMIVHLTDDKLRVLSTLVGKSVRSNITLSEILAA